MSLMGTKILPENVIQVICVTGDTTNKGHQKCEFPSDGGRTYQHSMEGLHAERRVAGLLSAKMSHTLRPRRLFIYRIYLCSST